MIEELCAKAGDETRALVLHIDIQTVENHYSALYCLDEAIGLARAIALDVVHAEIVPLKKIVPATLLGRGAVDRLKLVIEDLKPGLVIINSNLTPIQQRMLEKHWSVKVIDRVGLIIEIFGARARTAEGALQVELAALSYQRSRLVRSWTHLERQRGGFGFTGGPGEKQLEMDRRLIDERIVRIKRDLEKVKKTRGLHRKSRKKVPYPIVALVGYTNAGKSTLFNRLTQSVVFAEDLLFATLDPTMRRLELPSGKTVILSDTVGFISDLPTQLITAFRATLEEVCEADLIIHVRDASHAEFEQQAQDVYHVLEELGLSAAQEIKMIEVFNKIDLLNNDERLMQGLGKSNVALISALTGEGCGALQSQISTKLSENDLVRTFILQHGDGAAMAWLYQNGEVLERAVKEDVLKMTVRLSKTNLDRLKKLFCDRIIIQKT